MYVNNTHYTELRKVLTTANTIYKEYDWLLDSYVSDFYINQHWNKLPRCWQESLKHINAETLASIIDCTTPLLNCKIVLPLSLLSLRVLIRHLQVAREQSMHYGIFENALSPHSLLRDNEKIFWKRVKMKKRHEIEVMSEICYKMAVQTKCYFVVDIGSGLGHLIRILSYGYGMKVCGLEAQEELTLQARKLDKKIEQLLQKNKDIVGKTVTPIHLNIKIKSGSDGSDIITILEDTFCNKLNFGIVGLHPCGDLAVTLLQLFVKCPRVKFINVVGCCYMKLNTSLNNFGYPLSNLSKEYKYSLSYSALEVACHALEMYVKKLRSREINQLRIHSYRAALEKLIVLQCPEMNHTQIRGVKNTDDLTFSVYVAKSMSKLNIELNSEAESDDIKRDLKDWRDVVSFYSLRLMLAPLVETIVLLDRVLFIIEHGHSCYITPVFDPNVSPRNCVISAIKE